MQITLIESEIKQALLNYIHSQINIKDGMQVTIDLKATRGDQGTTAIIDIVAAETVAAVVVEPVVEEVVEQPKPTTRRTRSTPVEAVKETPVVEATAVEEAEEAEPTVEETLPEAAAVEEVVETEEAAPAAETKPQSLFANLRRPQNG